MLKCILVEFLDFVDVFFQSGVFECVLVCGGLSSFYGAMGRVGAVVTCICKTYLCTPIKLLRVARNEGAIHNVRVIPGQNKRRGLGHFSGGGVILSRRWGSCVLGWNYTTQTHAHPVISTDDVNTGGLSGGCTRAASGSEVAQDLSCLRDNSS